MGYLTDADKRILPLAMREKGGFHIASEWYFGRMPMPWQYAWHHLLVANTYAVCGIASGKTTIGSDSIGIDCMTIPFFRALTTSITVTQAELSYHMFMASYDASDRVRHLVSDIQKHPFKKIIFKNGSEWEFRTAGRNADNLRGSEYDRSVFDEAGFDPSGEIVKVLRGRLRGKRPTGIPDVPPVPRMARLDVITSPTDASWLIDNFNKGVRDHPDANLDLYRSIRIATWDNIHLTESQVEAMKAEYPPDLVDVEMGGLFPDYGMSMFPAMYVAGCTDISLYDAVLAETAKNKPKPGYVLYEDPRHGIVHFEMPVDPGRLYIAAGDPGTGSYPNRNAGCVMVADITDPTKLKLVYFDWITGKGSYNPFLRSYQYAIDTYVPIYKGIDATGTQKALDELAFENIGIETDRINFSTDKNALLNSLIADITNYRWRFPPIKGLVQQLKTYSLEADKDDAPQDTVMTIAQLSFLARFSRELGGGQTNGRGVRMNVRDRAYAMRRRR